MRSLITGANGFTGSHLVKILLKQGHSVKGLVRQSSNLFRIADCDLQLVYGDIGDKQALTKAMEDVDYVFHTAAYVDLGIVDAREMHRVNVEGTQAVLSVAEKTPITKLVYCSTIGIYGDTKGEIVDESFVRRQQDFSSAYDRTKYLAQQLVDEAASRGLPVVSILPSGIFGPDDPHFGPVIKLFTEGKLKLWIGGDRVTGIVHVDDLAEAMIMAAKQGKSGEKYIISAGELKTKEMFQILAQKTGKPVPREIPESIARILGQTLEISSKVIPWNPPLNNERIHYVYDRCVRVTGDKARRELKWSPRTIYDTIISTIT